MTNKSYNDILQLRRDLTLMSPSYLAPILSATLLNDGSYGLELTDFQGREYFANTGTGQDKNDFVTNRLKFCNRVCGFNSPSLNSKHFDKPTSWVYGKYNSLFVYQVMQNKVIYPFSFISVMDKDVTFPNGSGMRVVMLQTADGVNYPPPLHSVSSLISSVSSSLTFEVADISLFNVGDHLKITVNNVNYFRVLSSISSSNITLNQSLPVTPQINDSVTITNPTKINGSGWTTIFSDEYLDLVHYNFDPEKEHGEFKATVFKYPSPDSVYHLAHHVENIKNTVKSEYDYLKKPINVSFCNTERIEIYNTNHEALTSPNGVPSFMGILFRVYDKW